MNILVISPIYYIEGRESLFHDSSAVHYLARQLAPRHRVIACHLYVGRISKMLRYLDATERRYHRHGYHFTADGVQVHLVEVQKVHPQWHLTPWQTGRVHRLLTRWLSQDGFTPDVMACHIPTLYGHLALGLCPGVPRMAVLHNTDLWHCQRRRKYVDEINRTFATSHARSFVLREQFARLGIGSLSGQVLSSGTPIMDLGPRTKGTKPLRILYAGKLIPRKHVDMTIRSLAMLQDTHDFVFDIYGDGGQRDELERLASQTLRPGRYAFHGPVSRHDVLEAMHRADVFVMPSEGETLGLVYLEAMSQGNIVIGSRGEGIDGVLVDGDNGLLVNPRSKTELTHVLARALTMREGELDRMRQRAYETALENSEERAGERYLDALQGCLCQGQMGRVIPSAPHTGTTAP